MQLRVGIPDMINKDTSENVSYETIEPDAAALIESLREILTMQRTVKLARLIVSFPMEITKGRGHLRQQRFLGNLLQMNPLPDLHPP